MEKKEKDTSPHFIKKVPYAKKEPWRTDVIMGQKGVNSHAHISLSGQEVYYLRDQQGEEIIKSGKILSDNASNSDSFFLRMKKILKTFRSTLAQCFGY